MGKLWIEDEHLRLDSGIKTKAIAPAVIAASRVTDVPAHYCDWFFERLRRGYMAVPMVGSSKRRHRYVSFANTQFIVFFSKNPRPLISYLPRLKEKDIDFYINYTLNDYSHLGFESGLDIEAPLQMRIDTFKRLSDAAGPERVVWHFDPLILSPKIKVDTLLERISSIAEQLKGYTNRLVFGFLNVPKDSIVESNLSARKMHYKPWKKGMKAVLVQEIAKANKKWGFELSTCSDAESYDKYGVTQGRCVDYQLIARLAWRNDFLMNTIGAKIYTYDPQPSLFGDVDPLPEGAIMLDSNHYILPEDDYKRSNSSAPADNQCRCNYAFDIGVKGTCTYKCAYCYAAEPSYRLDANVKAHSLNPTAASLTGETDDQLRITIENKAQPKGIQLDRSLKSMNSGRVEFDEKADLAKDDPLYIIAKKIFGNKDEITVKDIEQIKRWHKSPIFNLGNLGIDLSFLDEDKLDIKNQNTNLTLTETEEVIIDPEDEVDPFFQEEYQDSELAGTAAKGKVDIDLPEEKLAESSKVPSVKESDDSIKQDSEDFKEKSEEDDDDYSEVVDDTEEPKNAENEDLGTEKKKSNYPHKDVTTQPKTHKEDGALLIDAGISKVNPYVDSQVDKSVASIKRSDDSILTTSNTDKESVNQSLNAPSDKVNSSVASPQEENSLAGKKYSPSSHGDNAVQPDYPKVEDNQPNNSIVSQADDLEDDSEEDYGDDIIPTDTSKNGMVKPSFNALEYLKELRESKRFNSEQEVLEEFVKKVNSMVIGVNDEIIGGVDYSDEVSSNLKSQGNNNHENTAGQEVMSSNTPSKDNNSDNSFESSTAKDKPSSKNVNTTKVKQKKRKELYGFLNKTYPDAQSDPTENPEVQGSSCITDYKDIQEQIEKAQLQNQWEEARRDFEMQFSPENLENQKPYQEDTFTEKSSEHSSDNSSSEDEDETSQESEPTDNWFDFNSEMSKTLEVDRHSLRNMMKRK